MSWANEPGLLTGPMSLARAPGRPTTGRVLTLDAAIGHDGVLLLENIHPDAATRLSKAGYQVETRAGRWTRTS